MVTKKQTAANHGLDIPTLLHKGLALQNRGKLQEAKQIYQKILAQDPSHPDALNLSGLIASHAQDFDRAKKLFTAAITSYPTMASFQVNLGLVHNACQEYPEAQACFTKATQLDPNFADGWFHLGNLWRTLGKLAESIHCYQKSLKINNEHPEALNNIGNSYRELGRLDEAIASFNQGIALDPTIPELHNNLGNTYIASLQADEAIACFKEACRLRPNFADPLNNIGYILHHQGKLHQSRRYLERALAIAPNESAILHNLGNVYKDMGDFDQAISIYRRALAIKPDFTNVHTNILFALNYAQNPDPALMFQEAKQWNQQQASHIQHLPLRQIPLGQRPLRVGYISPDFCIHSVSFFFLPLLTGHDSQKVETYCYADTMRPDSMTKQLQKQANHWQNIVGWSDEAVAQRIHTDEIDILVDLAGHTANNRLLVFARKPAPIQAAWLGYPNTTGLTTMDYRISDPYADPPGSSDPFYTEEIIQLPHSFLCYAPPDDAPEVAPPPVNHKKNITLGSFNNITKITKEVVAVWSAILQKLPGASLLLKGIIFSEQESRDHFFELFASQGIEAARLILKPRTATMEEHLTTYHEVDIALDPFPYNGTTTTCEALWMGVPVIALQGDIHCARVSASILHNCGHADLIATSKEEYISKAVALAQDLPRLQKLQDTIRQDLRQSHLCNRQQFCQEMEDAFIAMAKRSLSLPNPQPGEESPMPVTPDQNSKQPSAQQLNQQGEDFFNNNDLESAKNCFQQALDLDPDLGLAHNNLGVLFFQLQDYDQAISCFRQALARNPKDQAALDNLSSLLQQLQSQPTRANNQPTDKARVVYQNATELQQAIDRFPFWYHKIDLPFGLTTPGYAPLSKGAYQIPADLTGKRVLDVGAWDGHWTFEALKRGAKQVVAIDDFSDFLGSLEESDRKAWETFDFCKAQLGYNDDQCQRVDMSIYDLTPKTFGMFDIVFFFGTLYHLRYPLLALDTLSTVCTEEIFIESAIADDFSPYRGGLQRGYPERDEMIMEFYPDNEYGNNNSNWWCPSLICLVHLATAAGFIDCQGWKLTDKPAEISQCRGFVKGRKAKPQ